MQFIEIYIYLSNKINIHIDIFLIHFDNLSGNKGLLLKASLGKNVKIQSFIKSFNLNR